MTGIEVSYEKLEKLGEGTYGKVYKARDKESNELVALKRTRLEMDSEGIPSTTIREVSILKALSESNHIVGLLDVRHVEEDNKPILYLVFEHCSMDLKRYMDRNGKHQPLEEFSIQSFMYQLLKGMVLIHSRGVIHRDLKPQNLLVDQKSKPYVLKIADLGLGRQYQIPIKQYTHEIVTLWYRAPEVLLGSTTYSEKVDIWSIGCIFAEMANGRVLFTGDSEIQQLLSIFKILGTPNEAIWPGVTKLPDWHAYPQWTATDLSRRVKLSEAGLDLLSKMLAYEPAKRISCVDAINHPYFDEFKEKEKIESLENSELLPVYQRVINKLSENQVNPKLAHFELCPNDGTFEEKENIPT